MTVAEANSLSRRLTLDDIPGVYRQHRGEEKGLLKPEVKAGQIVAWLKDDFELGRGHAMAIYALLKPHMGT